MDAGYDGLNVTHPCKRDVLERLDELSPEAEALGAVNTVVIRDGRATGHNTDATGFAESVRRGLPGAALDRVVLLGAGGAGSAVAHALRGSAAASWRSSTPTASARAALADVRSAGEALERLDLAEPTGSCTRRRRAWRATPASRSTRSCCTPACGSPTSSTGRWRPSCCAWRASAAAARWTAAAWSSSRPRTSFELFTGVRPDRERMLRHFAELTG